MSRSHRLCLRMVAFGAPRSRRAAVIAAIGIFCASPFSATGLMLGGVAQQSGLGQTLRVMIPVTLGEGEEIPAECFKLAPSQGPADGVPDLLYGRVNVERSAAGSTLVVTTPRPVNDPVVRITIRAGCETSVRREYTLFMDPPAIEAPVVAAPQPSPREVLGLAPPERAPATARRTPKPPAAARSAQAGAASAAGVETPDKGAPAKARPGPRATPKPPPSSRAAQPRLSVSSGPGTLPGSLATEADRERARQERANAIEAETAALRQRIVELTAMVERMQAELRAQEAAEQAAAAQAAKAPEAAKVPEVGAPPAAAPETAKAPDAAKTDSANAPAAPAKAEAPAPVQSWWAQNVLLIAAIIGLPLVIAGFLLWKRRRDAGQDDMWRTHAALARPDTLSWTSQLRNTAAGLAPPRGTVSHEMESPVPPRDAVDALAVSEVSHVRDAPEELDIDEDLIAAGKLKERPKANTAVAAGRKPMPPDQTASHPAQQPIRFEVEPQEPSERKGR